MTRLDDALMVLNDSVVNMTTVAESAIAYINGVPAIVQAAIDEALEAGATAENLAAVQAAADRLRDDATSLSAALFANTPDDPPPMP